MPNLKDEPSVTPGPYRATTIREVAEKAGVSIATVSRVISGTGGVSKKLEKRVQNAIKTLDFRPNQVARRLRARSTKVIGVVINDIQNPFNHALIEGIESVLQENDFLLLLGNTSDNPQREQQKLDTFLSEDVTGLIFVSSNQDATYYNKFLEKGIALVAVDRKPTNLRVDCVQVDNEEAAYRAIQHLTEEGHRRIGLVAGPLTISTAAQRCAGYQRGLVAAGLTVDPELIQIGNFRQAGGYTAMGALLDQPNPPSAVLVSNNLMTLGALQMIHERELNIPDQIALIGFDDMPWAASLRPPLTVIAQPVYEMGAVAARLLVSRIQEPGGPIQQVTLDTRLIMRASCTCRGGKEAKKKKDN
jgi:LacI family transcriptional regulator